MIPECYGRTDRQTDRFAISISRLSMLTRDEKNKKTNTFWCAKSRMRGDETPGRIVTNFCTSVGVHDVIACADLHYDRLRSLGVAGAGSNFGFLH